LGIVLFIPHYELEEDMVLNKRPKDVDTEGGQKDKRKERKEGGGIIECLQGTAPGTRNEK
jgi:hypothetical protein